MSEYVRGSALTQCGVVVFMVVAVLVSFFFNNEFSLAAGAMLLAIYAVVGAFDKRLTTNVLAIFCLFSLLVVPVFVAINHSLNVVFYYFSTVVAFFAARRLALCDGRILLSGFRLSFYVLFCTCLFLYYLHRHDSEPFGAIIEGASTNGIPSYFIVLQVALSLVTYQVLGRLPLLSTVLTLVIAVLGIGRGSILAAVTILIISLFVNCLQDVIRRRGGRILAIVGVAAAVLVLGVVNYDAIFDLLYNRTNLSRGLYDPARGNMISDYLEHISLVGLFTGVSFEGTLIGDVYGGNPHNSFIRAHSYMGLGALLMILVSPFALFFFNHRLSTTLVYFAFLVVLLFRALSEPILFPTLLDFFYFFVFFLFFKRGSRSLGATQFSKVKQHTLQSEGNT